MCCQRAPSATPGLIAKLVGAGKYDPTASKSLGVLPVISVREQDDFYRWSEIKAPQLARGVEAEVVFFFCWSETESSGGLLLWLFFSCNGLTGVLSLQYHTPRRARVWQQMFSGAAAHSHCSIPATPVMRLSNSLLVREGEQALLWGRAHSPSHCQTFPATLTEQMGLPKLPFPRNCPVTFTQQKPACPGQERATLPYVIKGKIATDRTQNKQNKTHPQKVKERVRQEVECSLLIQLCWEARVSPCCSKISPAPAVFLQEFWGSPGLLGGSHAPRH